jgi:hypothetical protein
VVYISTLGIGIIVELSRVHISNFYQPALSATMSSVYLTLKASLNSQSAYQSANISLGISAYKSGLKTKILARTAVINSLQRSWQELTIMHSRH